MRRDAGAMRSVILTAFGDSAGTWRDAALPQALQDKVDRTGESAFCEGVYEGELSGQLVVVVTTGTGRTTPAVYAGTAFLVRAASKRRFRPGSVG